MKNKLIKLLTFLLCIILCLFVLASCDDYWDYWNDEDNDDRKYKNGSVVTDETTEPSDVTADETQDDVTEPSDVTTDETQDDVTESRDVTTDDAQGGTSGTDAPDDTAPHTHSYIAAVTAPTCTKEGYTTHTCACGDSYVDSYVDAKGHRYGSWETTKEASCTKSGEEKRACFCGEEETRPTDKKDHSYIAAVTAPTCTKEGYTTHTCACGDSYVDSYVGAQGHKKVNGFCNVCQKTVYSEGLEYTLSDDQRYYIVSGEGKCRDAEINVPKTYNGLPVKSIGYQAFQYYDSITEIIIPDSVTVIEEDALAYCPNLKNVIIGKGVTNIGSHAFFRCENLETVRIGESIEIIGNEAFSDCYSLENVNIPNSVTTIGNGAFSGCGSFTELIIPDSVTSIGNYAFASCSKLVNVSIGKSITKISIQMFEGCRALTDINIPDNITVIERYAFNGCDGLKNITMSSKVVSIGAWAFSNCTGLTDIIIPKSVTNIDADAFYKCTEIETLSVEEGNKAYSSSGNCIIRTSDKTLVLGCKNSIIPTDGSVVCIGNHAFYNCVSLKSITIPATVISFEEWPFSGCKGLESIVVDKDNPIYHSYENCIISTISKELIIGCKNSIIPTDGSVMVIGPSAFDGCTGLVNIRIPDTVTTIRNYAFSGTGLLNITIPESVTEIEAFAFSSCKDLVSVTLKTGNVEIANTAFSYCNSLVEIVNNSNLEIEVGSNDYGFLASKAIEVHSGESRIVDKDGFLFYTYNGVNYLIRYVGTDTELTLPDDYNGEKYEIFKFAFCNAAEVTEIVISDGVTKINNSAFFGCENLQSITISESVEVIGGYAFQLCHNLKNVTISAGVKFIEACAFDDCLALQNVTFEGTMDEWNAISKGYKWNRGTTFTVVHCSDGDVAVE